jgi:hypothetical protein
MAKSHIIALPSQELSELRCAAAAPQFAQLFEQLPFFRAALLAPVDNEIDDLADVAKDAIREACANTNHPEEWAPGRRLATRMQMQLSGQAAAKAATPPLPAPKPYGNQQCPCCGGKRIASVYSKACNGNYFRIKHLDFEADGYMPSNFGIPGDGDGPSIEVCLDCGRVVNGEYPLPDDVLQQRVTQYKVECL